MHHGEWHSGCDVVVNRDMKVVSASSREWQVEHENGPCFDLSDSGAWFVEFEHAVTTDDLFFVVVEKADAYGVFTDLGSFAFEAKNEMHAWMHRGEASDPELLEDTHD